MTVLYECDKCGDVVENTAAELEIDGETSHLCRDCTHKVKHWLMNAAVMKRTTAKGDN